MSIRGQKIVTVEETFCVGDSIIGEKANIVFNNGLQNCIILKKGSLKHCEQEDDREEIDQCLKITVIKFSLHLFY